MEWDEYFLKIAETVALRSKDPSTKVGTVITTKNHRPISFGYNGLIQHADESKLNAMIFSHCDLKDCTVYSSVAPCVDCLRHLLQAGVTRIVYRQLHVNSHAKKAKSSMQNEETDKAIIALLEAMPHVETLNYTNGKNYIEDLKAAKE